MCALHSKVLYTEHLCIVYWSSMDHSIFLSSSKMYIWLAVYLFKSMISYSNEITEIIATFSCRL